MLQDDFGWVISQQADGFQLCRIAPAQPLQLPPEAVLRVTRNMIDEILRCEPAKRFALRLIKKHLPVPERRVHSSAMQHRLVQRYLWRRIGGNVDAFSFCRDDHGIDRRFSVARDLRVPHTVQQGESFSFRPGAMHKVAAVTRFKMMVMIVRN